MSDKRVSDPTIVPTDFDEAVNKDGKLLIDWEELRTENLEAREIPLKLLGNCYIQGSTDGTVYTSTVNSQSNYIRISSDGGATWKVFLTPEKAHIEKNRLTNFTEYNVNVQFTKPFTEKPICVAKEPLVYREVDIGGGKYRREDVSFYFSSVNWLSTTGFSLIIDSDEDLSGVVIEYIFEEK